MAVDPYSSRVPKPSSSICPIEVEKRSQIEHYINERFPHGSSGGCRLVIMKEGQTLFSYTTGVPMDAPQHFGSVSKQFTAAAVLELQSQGHIDLQRDIHTYLPRLPPFTYQGKPAVVTVDDLMHMCSGLPDCVNLAFLRGCEDQNLSQSDKMSPIYNAPAIELGFQPGMRFHYCNSNYYLLSDLVQAVSGQDLRTYAHEHLFGPLGMEHTDFIDPDLPITAQSLPGYAPDGTEITTRNMTWGACGVIGTPLDMVLWDAKCASLPMWSLLIEEPFKGAIYARGLHVEHVGSYRLIHHPGGIEGFQTMYLRVESDAGIPQFSVFIASNRDGHQADMWAKEIANLYLGHKLIPVSAIAAPSPAAPIELTYDKQAMQTHVGHYFSSSLNTTHALEVIEHHGNWVLKMSPVGADENFSFYFAQDASNPNRYVSVGKIGGAEILFTADGFVFNDPGPPIPPIPFIRQI